MNNYNEILNKIRHTLIKEDVISNIDEVSVYDLYNIVNNKFKRLRDVVLKPTLLKNKEKIIKTQKKINFSIKEKVLTIHVIYPEKRQDSFRIYKSDDREDIYFTEQSSSAKRYIKKYYDEIMYVFSILEEYRPLVLDIYPCIDLSFDDLVLTVSYQGEVDLNVKIPSDQNDIYLKKDNNNLSLKQILDENKFELAKKKAVKVDSLSETLQSMVKDHLVKEQLQKVVRR